MQTDYPLGDFLRALRASKRLSMREAAKLAGIQVSRYFELEKGITTRTGEPVVVTRENILQLTRLGVPAATIVRLAFHDLMREPAEADPAEVQIVDLYRALPSEWQRFWVTMGLALQALPPPAATG